MKQTIVLQHKEKKFSLRRYHARNEEWKEFQFPLRLWVEIVDSETKGSVDIFIRGKENPLIIRKFTTPSCEASSIVHNLTKYGWDVKEVIFL